jgi:site-specific DNA-cytosine methylase
VGSFEIKIGGMMGTIHRYSKDTIRKQVWETCIIENEDKIILSEIHMRTDNGEIIKQIEKEITNEEAGIYKEKENGKSGTLRARAREDESCSQLASINSRIRRLTPIECERLQTVKDNYTNHVSDSQRYKMLGNGWNIDTIAHIFSYIKK